MFPIKHKGRCYPAIAKPKRYLTKNRTTEQYMCFFVVFSHVVSCHGSHIFPWFSLFLAMVSATSESMSCAHHFGPVSSSGSARASCSSTCTASRRTTSGHKAQGNMGESITKYEENYPNPMEKEVENTKFPMFSG